MSFTRLDYDCCAYAQDIQESTGSLDYHLYQGKYINCKNCPKHTNNLSFGVRAEVENELRNQTRYASKCSSNKYNPDKGIKIPKTTNPLLCEILPTNECKATNKGFDDSKLGRACCKK